MTKDALAAFEATLQKEPRRLGATLGAAKASEKLGDAPIGVPSQEPAFELTSQEEISKAY
jgi:hypothetical protein